MPNFNKILDTFLFKKSEIFLKDIHVDRVFETYEFLNSEVERETLARIYDSIEKQLKSEFTTEKLVRVLLDPVRPQKHTFEVKELEALNSPINLSVVQTTEPITKASPYKFADRPEWDSLLANLSPDSADVMLIRNGLASETSRFNLFLHDIENDFILTPTLKSGCINGVFRRSVLREGFLNLPDGTEGAVVEEDFTLNDMDGKQLYVGNSVRGLLLANII